METFKLWWKHHWTTNTILEIRCYLFGGSYRYTCVYIYVCICVCVCVFVYIYIHKYIYIYTPRNINIINHTHITMYVHILHAPCVVLIFYQLPPPIVSADFCHNYHIFFHVKPSKVAENSQNLPPVPLQHSFTNIWKSNKKNSQHLDFPYQLCWIFQQISTNTSPGRLRPEEHLVLLELQALEALRGRLGRRRGTGLVADEALDVVQQKDVKRPPGRTPI